MAAGHTHKGVEYDRAGAVRSCLFCRIVQGSEPGGAPLHYSDGRVAVFVPRAPRALYHFLVVPVDHVRNAKSLNAGHEELLLHMQRTALRVLRTSVAQGLPPHTRCCAPPLAAAAAEVDVPPLGELTERKFHLVFHWPPWNSIDHLHLHAVCTPYTWWGARLAMQPFSSTLLPFLHSVRTIDAALAHARAHKVPHQ